MKVERVTYPVMTPTAARGVLEAIFWKPEFTWRVQEIWVLRPIEYFSILRNEMNTRQTERIAASWARAGAGGFDATADRAQRHTLALSKVEYLIRADVELRPHATDDAAKYRDQFRRRVRDGRCFATPFLGCREFSAAFSAPDGTEQPIEADHHVRQRQRQDHRREHQQIFEGPHASSPERRGHAARSRTRCHAPAAAGARTATAALASGGATGPSLCQRAGDESCVALLCSS